MAAPEPGSQVPVFELKDVEGKPHSRRELANGRLLLLAFYHRECPTCQFAAPALGAMSRRLKSPRNLLWGVSQDSPRDSAEFATANGIEFTLLVDAPKYRVSNAFGLTTVPTLVLVGADGRVLRNCVGFSRRDFELITADLARHGSLPAPDLFAGYAQVPEFKPG